MHGIGMDLAIKDWFDFRVPETSLKRNYVEQAITATSAQDNVRSRSRVLWIENRPQYNQYDSTKKGIAVRKSRFEFYTKTEHVVLSTSAETGEWLHNVFNKFSIQNTNLLSIEELKQDYEQHCSSPFSSFLGSREWNILRRKGLLLI
jgi:hypothetical protein